MRPMDIDPTFAPYLRDAIASRPVPLHLADVTARRAEIRAARAKAASAPPAGIRADWLRVGLRHGAIRVLVFRRDRDTAASPAILYCHGGGWMYGSPEQSQELAYLYVQQTDAIVVSPEYRLTPDHRFPAAFDDCYGVLCWMKDRASDLQVDPERLALAGESAGANLAAACAIEARERGGPRARIQLLNYPALGTDFETCSYRENQDAPILSRDEMVYFWREYLGAELDTRDARAVPLAAVSFAGLPAARIVVAEYDPLRDDGIRYADKLKAAGVAAELVHAKRLTHGFFRALAVSEDVKSIAAGNCAALRAAFQA